MPFPEGFTAFTNVYYVSSVANGDRIVAGNMSLSNWSQVLSLPAPEFPNQEFCGVVILGPGVSAHAYVPTPAEKAGDFSALGGVVTDPLADVPFPGSYIPLSRIPGIWAWRVKAAGVINATQEVEIINAGSGKVLDVRDLSSSNMAPIQEWDYLGGLNQRWRMVPVDVTYAGSVRNLYPLDAVYFKFQNVLSGKVLDVLDVSSENGARIQQYDYLGGDNQKWQMVPVDAINYKIVNKLSGKVLDVENHSKSNGGSLQQWDYLGGDNQKWQIVPIVYVQIANQLSGKALDVQGYSTANGARIQQWDYLQGANQQWLLIPVDGQYIKIESVLSHKVLDVINLSVDNGAPIQQWDYLGGDNQKWQILPAGTGVQIINKLSGRALEVRDYSLDNGGIAQQWDYLNGGNQKWSLTGSLPPD
jgi:hypothetical protein